jgi:carbon storage regulator
MLVLSRQRDETIMIGDEIEITVVDIRGDKVRLGISAPARIAVHRKEVYDAIRIENLRASQIEQTDLTQLRPAGLAPGVGSGPLPTPISPGPAKERKAPARPPNPLVSRTIAPRGFAAGG